MESLGGVWNREWRERRCRGFRATFCLSCQRMEPTSRCAGGEHVLDSSDKRAARIRFHPTFARSGIQVPARFLSKWTKTIGLGIPKRDELRESAIDRIV